MQYNVVHWMSQWISPKSSVLDLGCGDGSLLAQFMQSHQVQAYGVENNPEMVISCLAKGVNVLQIDLDKGLANFKDTSFDLVILKNTLQALQRPHHVIDEMLRIGKKGIVTFHNFSHWYNRWYLLAKGEMPVSESIPYTWYSTPNVHHCTCRDFEILCDKNNIRIEASLLCTTKKKNISFNHPLRNFITNEATYLISKK